MSEHRLDASNAYPAGVARTAVGASTAVGVVYRLMLRQLRSTGRLIALSLLSLTVTFAGVFVRISDTAVASDAAGVITAGGLALVLPIVCLVFAGSAIGDLREDKTLVYLWLRPMDRWTIVAGALLGALTVAAPVVAIPIVLAAVIAGHSLALPTFVATAVGLIAYSSIFVSMGVWLRRYIGWGLAYVLIWEGFLARIGGLFGRLSISGYTRSIVHELADIPSSSATFSLAMSLIVPLVISAIALALGAWRIGHQDVD